MAADTILLRSADHPCAGGGRPQPGDQAWTFEVPLDGGGRLLLGLGRKARELLLEMLMAENAADAAAMMRRRPPPNPFRSAG